MCILLRNFLLRYVFFPETTVLRTKNMVILTLLHNLRPNELCYPRLYDSSINIFLLKTTLFFLLKPTDSIPQLESSRVCFVYKRYEIFPTDGHHFVLICFFLVVLFAVGGVFVWWHAISRASIAAKHMQKRLYVWICVFWHALFVVFFCVAFVHFILSSP